MKYRLVAALAVALLLASLLTGSASAHANLLRCSIKNGQVFTTANAPKHIQAFFAENLDPKQSFIAVFANREDHGLVNEKTHSSVNFRNPKELTLALPALLKGPYMLLWYTHSEDDGHFASGVVYFSVK